MDFKDKLIHALLEASKKDEDDEPEEEEVFGVPMRRVRRPSEERMKKIKGKPTMKGTWSKEKRNWMRSMGKIRPIDSNEEEEDTNEVDEAGSGFRERARARRKELMRGGEKPGVLRSTGVVVQKSSGGNVGGKSWTSHPTKSYPKGVNMVTLPKGRRRPGVTSTGANREFTHPGMGRQDLMARLKAFKKARQSDDIHSAFTAEGKSTGGDVYATMAKLAHWREKAKQAGPVGGRSHSPSAGGLKPGEEGYTRKAYPRNVNPDFPGEAQAQHKRGESVVRKIIRGGEMTRAHRDTEREARGDRHGTGFAHLPAGVRRTHAPAIGDETSHTKEKFEFQKSGGPKGKYDNAIMGYGEDGKFTYPKGRKQARAAARAGAELGATKARKEKQ